MFLPKTNEQIQLYYLSTCFRSFFGRKWRYKKDISKLTDGGNYNFFPQIAYSTHKSCKCAYFDYFCTWKLLLEWSRCKKPIIHGYNQQNLETSCDKWFGFEKWTHPQHWIPGRAEGIKMPLPPPLKILPYQLTLFKLGGRLYPLQYYSPSHIFRHSYGPESQFLCKLSFFVNEKTGNVMCISF